MDFKDFVKAQFQPCIFCHATSGVANKFPNYFETILEAWEKIRGSLKIPIRIIFQNDSEKIAELQFKLVSSRENHFNELYNDQIEMESMKIIREFYFKCGYMNHFYFPDIPMGFLIVSLKNETFNVSEFYKKFPKWLQRHISKAKMVKMIFPSHTIAEPILNWINSQIFQYYNSVVQKIDKIYQEEWNGIHKRISAFFGGQDDPYTSSLNLKFFADLCVQRGLFVDAVNAYQIVINNTQFKEFINESHFCIALCDILSDQITQSSLKHAMSARSGKLPVVDFFIFSLTEFHIRVFLGVRPIEALNKYPQSPLPREKEFERLFKPFFFEQNSVFVGKHHFPYVLSLAARLYNHIGAVNLSSLCYHVCIDCFNGSNWPNISQPLGIRALKVISKTENSMLDVAVNMLSSRRLPHSRKLGNFIKEHEIDFPMPCGFVRARITDFYCPGFPGVQIKELNDLTEWKQTSERMFGAFQRDSFFDFNAMSLYQCCVGEEVTVEVQLKIFAEIDVENVYLLTNGSGQVLLNTTNESNFGPGESEKKKITVNRQRTEKVISINIKYTPIKTGEIELYGVGFDWTGICKLECPFKHLPLKCKIFEPTAKIDFIFGDVCNKVVVGQYVKIDVLAKNGPIPLDSFSLLIKGDVEAFLIEPEVENIFGQSKMRPLRENEDSKIVVSARFLKEGNHKLMLIFPYWSKQNPPPRYGMKVFEFDVYHPPSLRVEYSQSGVQIFSPEHSWALGFTGTFQNKNINLNHHLIVANGRLCLLDFVSTKNHEEEFALPKICEKFIHKDININMNHIHMKQPKNIVNFLFWYENYYGIVQTKIEWPNMCTPVSISMRKENLFYVFSISNLTNQKLKNLSFTFGSESSSNNVFVSGLKKKCVKELDVDETITVKNYIMLLENNVMLPITLVLENSIFSFSLYIDENSFI